MDIMTPNGQAAMAQEQACYAIFTARTGVKVIQTKKDRPAAVDGVLTKDDTIVGVLEQKTRSVTFETMMGDWGGRWLVTASKIEKARDIAVAMCAPLIGFLYLAPSRMLLVQKIATPDGEWATEIGFEETWTQATCNGGQALRVNAFISVHAARVYTGGG